MNQFLHNSFLQLRLQFRLAHLRDLVHCPCDELLNLGPAVLHRLRIEHYYDKLEVVLANRGCQAGPRRGRDACLEP